MFSRTRSPSTLDLALEEAIRSLDRNTVGSQEYVKTLDVVAKLHKMRQEERPSSVSMDTLVLAATNILGILLIIKAEHVNVLSARAMSLLIKPR